MSTVFISVYGAMRYGRPVLQGVTKERRYIVGGLQLGNAGDKFI